MIAARSIEDDEDHGCGRRLLDALDHRTDGHERLLASREYGAELVIQLRLVERHDVDVEHSRGGTMSIEATVHLEVEFAHAVRDVVTRWQVLARDAVERVVTKPFLLWGFHPIDERLTDPIHSLAIVDGRGLRRPVLEEVERPQHRIIRTKAVSVDMLSASLDVCIEICDQVGYRSAVGRWFHLTCDDSVVIVVDLHRVRA